MAGVIESVLSSGRTLTGWIHTDGTTGVTGVRVTAEDSDDQMATVTTLMVRNDVEQVTKRPGAAVEIQLQSPIDLVRFSANEFTFTICFADGTVESINVARAALVTARRIAEERLSQAGESEKPLARRHPERPNSSSQQSYVQLPAGYKDPQGAVTLGYDGWVFLSEGSNRLTRQYGPFDDDAARRELLEEPLQGWIRTIQTRASIARDLRIEFRQLVLPEKNSCLPELCFDEISPPTPLYQAIMRHEGVPEVIIDGYRELGRIADQKLIWTRNDNHMDCLGAYLAAVSILSSLGLEDPLRLTPGDFSVEKFRVGNIAGEIIGVPVWDRVRFPSSATVGALPIPEIVEDRAPAPGSGHSYVGASRQWINHQAPIQAALLLFGSSTANLGDSPVQMSWWLARMFRSFEFHWDWNLNGERLSRSKPDFVVSQTAERFLIRVPVS